MDVIIIQLFCFNESQFREDIIRVFSSVAALSVKVISGYLEGLFYFLLLDQYNIWLPDMFYQCQQKRYKQCSYI